VVASRSHQIIGGSIRCVPTRATVVSVEYGNASNPEQQLTVEVRGAVRGHDLPQRGVANDVSFTLIVP
jgi:hypothetical protein